MHYEEVYLEEKIVVGIGARTQNSDTNMPTIIGGLWRRFFEDGIYGSIPYKVGKRDTKGEIC